MSKKILQHLLQLFCNHKWILVNEIETYWDYSGYKVHIWRCKCPNCNKWNNKKFY